MDYKKSGVDILAGNETLRRVKPLIKKTFNHNVLSELGSFGGLFALEKERWSNPVLISSTDGVGTKLCVAKAAGKYDTIGRDLVNHCVNDIFVHGASPLFFLDYIGINKIDPEKIEGIVRGMVIACKEHGMALIGGETAEMPDIYDRDDFDLVGTIIGCLDRDKIINGDNIQEGDGIVGFASSGLHTNGYTLARKILFEKKSLNVDDYIDFLGNSIGEELLTVHKSYYHQLKGYATPDIIHGMAHITGGGIAGNLSRIIPDGLLAEIYCRSWAQPRIFTYLQEEGEVSEPEMFNVFNMGMGFIVVASPTVTTELVREENCILIGRVCKTDTPEKVILKQESIRESE